MLSSVALRAGELLAAAVLAGGVLLAVAAAAVWWLRRRIRRRLQVLGLALAGRAQAAAAGAASGRRRWAWSLPAPGRRWIAAGRARRKLWRAVGAAGHAVAVARKAGAPTGDLDALCRRLRQAAADADRSLAMAGRATGPGHQPELVSTQVTDLMLAAGAIQDAAASSVASISRPAGRSLADDACREAEALSAGIASAQRGAAGVLPGEPE
jgi:hypothetical protein